MSTFKCGLRRFDGHGTSSYRPTNPEAKKEMETAYQRMMHLRDQQDQGVFSSEHKTEPIVEKNMVPKPQPIVITKETTGTCYSLSDSTNASTSS
jgi:hypothetical protein